MVITELRNVDQGKPLHIIVCWAGTLPDDLSRATLPILMKKAH